MTTMCSNKDDEPKKEMGSIPAEVAMERTMDLFSQDDAPIAPRDARPRTSVLPMDRTVYIHTGCVCHGNPGPGGWGAVMIYQGRERQLLGHESRTTSNRMEMTALIQALKALKRPCRVEVVTHSQYLERGGSTWLPEWPGEHRREDLANLDLWDVLSEITAVHQIRWRWVSKDVPLRGMQCAKGLARDAAASARST